MEAWQWILSICGGVSAVGAALAVIAKWMQPLREHSKRMEKLEQQNKRDLERFDDIARELKHARLADQAVYLALSSIMNHMIDGNHVDKLKEARDALNKHIIEQ